MAVRMLMLAGMAMVAAPAEGGAGIAGGLWYESAGAFISTPPNKMQSYSTSKFNVCSRFPGVTQRERNGQQLRCALDRVEEKAVEKFTKQFDKLCKTCPSRLQSRPETLVAMFQGLDVAERNVAMAQMQEIMAGGSPQRENLENLHLEKIECEQTEPKPMKQKESKDTRLKIMRKIEEREMKWNKYRALLALLESADGLPEGMVEEKKMREYKMMSLEEREIEKLHIKEKIAKCERKMAEYRYDLSKLETSCMETC
eukprot:236724-Hanusia_phi.AAC.1